MAPQSFALLWTVLALMALLAELHSRTVYLLALAAALGLAAGLGFWGAGSASQCVALALGCLAGFPLAALVRRHQSQRTALASADLGAEVSVIAVSGAAAAGAAKLRVFYRGTEWDALYAGSAAVGDHLRIAALRGSVLELAPKA